jgi:hypothetical protein
VVAPLLVSVLCLAIIGASAWYIVAARSVSRVTERPAATISASPAGPTAPPCRAETQKQAADAGAVGTVREVLMVRTRTSVAWICADERDQIYYHGLRGGPDSPWIEGQTALFLPDVREIPGGAGAFAADVAEKDGSTTTIEVSSQGITVQRAGQPAEVQPAVPG